MTLPIFPIYTAILIFRRKILQKLEANAAHFRSETRSIHRQLLKALTLQAFLPTLFTIGASLFIMLEAKVPSNPVLECLIFAIPAPIPLFSCLISIYHIRPYRQALLHALLRINIPTVPKEHHSSAVALAPQHKVSVLSLSRIQLHRLSVPNTSWRKRHLWNKQFEKKCLRKQKRKKSATIELLSFIGHFVHIKHSNDFTLSHSISLNLLKYKHWRHLVSHVTLTFIVLTTFIIFKSLLEYISILRSCV